VQEARAVVGALRAAPMRGMDDVRSLTSGFPGEARLRISGSAGRLAPEAGHAVYRAVQEAMTNAARYATGSAIEVDIVWEDREVRVVVRDYGVPAGRVRSGVQGSGAGLRGMAERLEAVGGSLTAGPATDGAGWRIALQVPVVATAAATAAPTSTDSSVGGTSNSGTSGE
jgi:signal transduction histidine kinase